MQFTRFVRCSLPTLCLLTAGPAFAQIENVTKDLPYKTGPALTAEEKALCQLDIYAPKHANAAPVVVWFHGGGLTGGDKSSRQTAALCKTLSEHGIVVASANYRLNPAVKFPAYIEDAAASVAWMRENAAKWGGDPKKLFIGGHSAGGYLAAMIGTNPQYLRKHGLEFNQISGLIPVSGQMTTHFNIQKERGLPETTLSIDDGSPLRFVTKDLPPLLLIWGEKDLPLRAEENLFLAAAVRAAGNEKVKALSIPGRDHGGTISHFTEAEDPVKREILAFIEMYD